jgi:hypothetical protein
LIDFDEYFKEERRRADTLNGRIRVPVIEKILVEDGKIIGVQAGTGERFVIRDREEEMM